MKEKIKEYRGTKEFWVSIIHIAIPISFQQLITVGISLIDTLMLSKMGDTAYSAVSLCAQFITLFQTCCLGIGIGASVLVSRFWGMKDMKSLRKTITIMLRCVLGFCSVFFLITLLFPQYIMRMYVDDADIIFAGTVYLKYLLPALYCIGFSSSAAIVLQSVEQVKIPLIASIISFVMKIFLNWIFIFGGLGAPRLEIRGAALSTVVSRSLELLFIFGYLCLIDKKISYHLKDLRADCKDLINQYMYVSVPVLVSDFLLALGNNVVVMVMGHVGRTFAVAYSISSVALQFSTVLTNGLSSASAFITGHTIGKGEYEKAHRQGYTFIVLAFLTGCFAASIIMVLRKPLVIYYQVSEDVQAVTYDLMAAISIIVVFGSINAVLSKGVLRAGGDTKFLMKADIIFLWLVSIPLGGMVGLILHGSAFWVYIFLKIDYILKFFRCFMRFRSKKWIIKEFTSEQETYSKERC